jgi:ABC-2 type transport system permease protein
MSATAAAPPSAAGVLAGHTRRGGVWSVYRVERRKLSSQLAVRLLALMCVVGPFLFAAILRAQSGSPADSLYGVWVHTSGFALSLVVLSFAGNWGFPLIAGIVAGDLFSSEDRYGTWKMVLTRSCRRRDLFVGKLLAAVTFVLALLALTALATIVAGIVLVSSSGLVSLGGNQMSTGKTLVLVLVSWALCTLPALAFTSLGLLLSVAVRNGIMGVIGPAVAALAMQLLILVGTGIWAHMLLVSSAFNLWHPLFTGHVYLGPVIVAVVVSLLWTAACLTAAWLLLARRDFAGAPVARRQGWVMPVRVVAVLAAVAVLFAFAGNWGPKGVTAARLKASFTPTFNNLTLLQQRELGRNAPPGTKLNIVPTCSRRGSTPTGPGDWVCTMTVYIPQSGALPFQQTPVSYDVSVTPDGCYKAQSPPAFIGNQLMRDASGHNVVNPLYTVYGCFDPL